MLTILRASICLPQRRKMQHAHTKNVHAHMDSRTSHKGTGTPYTNSQIHTNICTYTPHMHTHPVHTHPTHTHTVFVSLSLCLCLFVSHTYSYEKWLIRLVTAIISRYEHFPKDPVVHTAYIHQPTSAKQGERHERTVLRGTDYELTFAICSLLGTSLAR